MLLASIQFDDDSIKNKIVTAKLLTAGGGSVRFSVVEHVMEKGKWKMNACVEFVVDIAELRQACDVLLLADKDTNG